LIFATVGTTSFDELIEALDKTIQEDEVIIAQIGNGLYMPTDILFFRFSQSLAKWYEAADFIITSGGAGSLFECLKSNKPFLAVENKSVMGRHQRELLDYLSKHGFIFMWDDLSNIRLGIEQAKEFFPNRKILNMMEYYSLLFIWMMDSDFWGNDIYG